MNLKRMIYLVLGFICLGAGCVGVVLPLLPSFPFFVGTAFFFAKSSDRLHRWFRGTSLYKEHLEPFLNKKGMTVQTKIRIIVMVTILMTFGFIMMKNVPIGRIILATVWLGHIVYFVFGVRKFEKDPVPESPRSQPET